ncbi:MAG: ATP-binding protein [Clostridia bacterium]|nr:ATP-binding protein [Clostridia bacterium]
MGYSPEAYEKLEALLSSYRRRAKEKIIERYNEISQKLPQIIKLEEEITSLGIELSKQAMKGKTNSDEDFAKLSTKIAKLEESKKEILKENGYSANYLSDAYNHSVCKDTGYVQGNLCSCAKKILASFDLSPSVLNHNKGFRDFSLDYYSVEPISQFNRSPRQQMQDVLQFCKAYTENFSLKSENLLMYGGAGLGKTFMCSCIAGELTNKGINVIFQSAYDIFETISKNKFNYKSDLDNKVAQLYNCDLLIMDDLGTEFSTEYTVSALFDIINTRLTLEKPTIINANLSLKDISSKYSDRIVSRLLTYRHLMFLGTDIRAKGLI